MNLRAHRKRPAETGVLLSPLIDCVFLLLVFFLVTSMIKRFERQIPVTLSDDTSAITPEPNDDSFPIGVDDGGTLYAPVGQNWSGVRTFKPLEAPGEWLKNLLAERGSEKPVTVVVERGTPFQKVIDAQDRLEQTGFGSIRFRIRDFPFQQTGDSTRND
ncbi:biopolymer transport protein ExbD [Haloferula luteola]|uniref:Biopolymer transport protein ExbD n=1 Tax=Haloferula luteola TaxID=595692 RepID=A0A840VE02_9BACT|nr:biopolymer transporter ExbD [Haloferula luteola]MBB5352059.1 biopolymer transport protein ExbD [Haloferula luteola]